MRVSEYVLFCVAATLCGGCPGTIDDLAAYQGTSYLPTTPRDGGSAPRDEEEIDEREDAAWPATDALDGAVRDAARDAGESDASAPTLVTDASGDDAAEAGERWPRDASADASLRDATVAAVDAGRANVDAGAGCDFRALMAAKCGNAGCHGAPAVSSGLDLVSDNLAQRVAGRMGSMSCATSLLIDTERPERSALYLKVTPNACGSRMPLGGTLTEREQMCVLQWITNL